MSWYRTKPCEIEAIQFTRDNLQEIVCFTKGNAFEIKDEPTKCAVVTLEGVMIASEFDYIIRGLRGEYYPCKPDVFAKKYEPIVTY